MKQMRTAGRGFTALAALLVLLASAAPAHAGMPSYLLSDLAEARLSTISFFLMLFLLCACLVRLLWNHLAKDFPKLPRLTYRRAVSVVLLWGLLFLIVLTMISGARELMTPGAWEKQGAVYKLRESGR